MTKLITQNVDGLHIKALEMGGAVGAVKDVLELHGTLHVCFTSMSYCLCDELRFVAFKQVHCSHSHRWSRSSFQDLISFHNPQWTTFAEDTKRTGKGVRTNPDGDVMLEGVAFDEFIVPECVECWESEGRRNSVVCLLLLSSVAFK